MLIYKEGEIGVIVEEIIEGGIEGIDGLYA